MTSNGEENKTNDNFLMKLKTNEEKFKKIIDILEEPNQGIVSPEKKVLGNDEFEEEFNFSKLSIQEKNLQKSANDQSVIVWKLKSKKEDKYYAVKCWTNLDQFTEKDICCIKDLRDKYYHQGIIKYLSIYVIPMELGMEKKCTICVKMDWYERTLKHYLESSVKKSDMELMWILNQGLKVIDYLKNQHHTSLFNLKPTNIFLDHKGNLKFSDFGMCQTNNSGLSFKVAQVGGETSFYQSPEYRKAQEDQKYEVKLNFEKVDIFSLGVIMLEAASDKQLDKGKKMENLQIRQYLKGCNTNVKDIIKEMLKVNLEERINSNQIKQKLFQDFDVEFGKKQ